MKIRIIILVAISAIVTLSFTFTSVKDNQKKTQSTARLSGNEPIGGFVSDEK